MSTKLIALGNVLMEDDGIAITIAEMLYEELHKLGVEVTYGETDIGYCISMVQEEDYLILLDAASLDKQPGEITILPLEDYRYGLGSHNQHDICLPDMLRLYFHGLKGIILAIEIAEVGLSYGLSPQLEGKVKDISKSIMEIIREHMSKIHNNTSDVDP